MDADRTKLAVRGFYDTQKLRIQLDLRMQRLVREGLMEEEEAKTFFHLPFSRFIEAEKEMQKIVWNEVKDFPIVKQWLSKVRGIGPRLSGLLVANIGDISRFDNVAKLWAYSGLHVIDGRAAKPKKGQKANWNYELKTTAWKIGQQFVKGGGPYRELYDNYKTRIIEREKAKGTIIYQNVNNKWTVAFGPQPDTMPTTAPEWTLGRIHNMAIRYAVKIFLSHLWHVWRTIENLPTRSPYAIEYLGHTTMLDPWDFVDEKETVKHKKKKTAKTETKKKSLTTD